MKASFDQQSAHRPASPTGARQAAQSCGSAASKARPKEARNAPARRAERLDRVSAAVKSPSMQGRYRRSRLGSTVSGPNRAECTKLLRFATFDTASDGRNTQTQELNHSTAAMPAVTGAYHETMYARSIACLAGHRRDIRTS